MDCLSFHVVIISDYLKNSEKLDELSAKGISVHLFDENQKTLKFLKDNIASLLIIDKLVIDDKTKELCSGIRKQSNYSSVPIVLSINKLKVKDVMASLTLGIDFIITGPVTPNWILHFIETSYEKIIDSQDPKSVRYQFDYNKYHLAIEPKKALTLLLSVIDDFVKAKDRVNTYIGIAAHDIRNPLSVIVNATQLFLEKFGSHITEEGNQLLSMICNSSNHILQILEEMLDISMLDSAKIQLKMTEVEFGELIQECYIINKALAKSKEIQMTLEMPKNLPRILCDDFKIKQVITNLLTNAIKFSNPNTLIKLIVSVDDKKVYVSVEDEGLGISSDDFSKIFHEFGYTQTKATGGEKSTGLGLAIAKKIMDLHGGEIQFSSEESRGSVFIISLSRT